MADQKSAFSYLEAWIENTIPIQIPLLTIRDIDTIRKNHILSSSDQWPTLWTAYYSAQNLILSL